MSLFERHSNPTPPADMELNKLSEDRTRNRQTDVDRYRAVPVEIRLAGRPANLFLVEGTAACPIP